MSADPVTSTPRVSVLLPVLDEVHHIDEVLASLAAQDYPGAVEVVVADGGSTDGTLERFDAWKDRLPGLRLLHNPRRVQSHGLNLAAEAASGEILVRADGHTTYAPDYLRRSVEVLLETGAVAVGGNQRAEGRTPFGRAVAEVMRSPLAFGPSAFRHASERRPADTVYLGAYRREDFLASGRYRALPSGVAEDADLYFRWRQAGRLVLFDPTIRSTYRPRETLRAFVRQNWRYGVGKGELLWLNGRWPSWRPLAPLGLVAGLVGSAVWWAVGGPWLPLVVVGAAWLAAVTAVAVSRGDSAATAGRIAAAIAALHLAYGIGLGWGLVRGSWTVRDLRRGQGAATP